MESPPLPEWWQPGPFDAFRAQEFVRGQPDGAALLLALLSALQCIGQPDARRVLFVANEAVPVLRWLTAATLLLPQQVALSVGFKVFTTNPAFAPQQVLAVHPDWSSSGASVDNDLGYVVFDLVRHVWSAVDASSTARLWTGLFLTEDPYDVVDAIEVAAASGLPDDVAPSLGLAAIMRRKPAPNEARTIVTWLRDAPSHLLETYGRTVADLLVESAGTWSPHLLITLDEAARRAAMGDRAGPVRLALIDAEVRQALTMRSVPPGVVDAPPTGTWGREEETAAVGMIVAALRSASPDQFDAVLRVAGRFGIRVPTAELGPALRAFAGHWADHPEWLHEPDLWPCRDEIVDLLRDELTTRLARYPSQANEIGDTWWPILIRDSIRLDNDLDDAAASAAMLHLPMADRSVLVRDCLAAAMRSPDPHGQVSRAADVLWRRAAPTADEARVLVEALPDGIRLDPRVFRTLTRRLLMDPKLMADHLVAARHLVAAGLLRPDQTLAQLLVADDALRFLCTWLPPDTRDMTDLNTQLRVLRGTPGRLVDVWEERLVEALGVAAPASVVVNVLLALPTLTGRFSQLVVREIPNNAQHTHVVVGFWLTRPDKLPAAVAQELVDPVRGRLGELVRHWLRRVSRSGLTKATDQVSDLGPMWFTLWRDMVGEERGRRAVQWIKPFRR
jgi:hypothetical protein